MYCVRHFALLAILRCTTTHVGAQSYGAPSYSIDSVFAFQPQNFLITVPAVSNGTIQFDIPNTLDTEQIADIRGAWGNLIPVSLEGELAAVEEEDNTASRSLAFFGFFGGNGKARATFSETRGNLKQQGVSDGTIAEMIGVFYEEVARINDIRALCTVDNVNNQYSISGNVVVLSMEGRVRIPGSDTTRFYRALSSQGVFAQSTTSQPLANIACTYTRRPTAAPTASPTLPPVPAPSSAPVPVPSLVPVPAPDTAPVPATVTDVPVVTSNPGTVPVPATDTDAPVTTQTVPVDTPRSAQGSCRGNCGSEVIIINCWCDTSCTMFNDCCPDYEDSCEG